MMKTPDNVADIKVGHKSPDEIKKGLEYCMSRYCAGARCPYFNAKSCNTEKTVDTLAYIQKLEADNAQQARCIENLTDKLNATNDALPRWISVEDEYPDTKLAVLGYGLRSKRYGEYDPFPSVHVVYTRGEDEGWFTYWNDEYVAVTHWMPLPEPPKEE